MANKKKKKSQTRRRRHRSMGAVNFQSIGMKIAGIAVGAFADNLARKNFTSLNVKILGAVEIAAGIFLPKFLKSSLGEGIGDGLIAVGAINLLKSFQVISGVGAMPARVPLRRPTIGPNRLAVGAAGNPYLTQTVGAMNDQTANLMMGALLYED